jgi:hypothetical protein
MARYKLDRNGRLPTITMMAMAITLISCSRDDVIAKDYKLYDLDGSNQTIIGSAGMVKVSDVTAYDVDGSRIIFET